MTSTAGVAVQVATVQEMHDLGRRLARALRAGDLVLLIGPLGAGKTALARGIGAGLGVRGEVTSPTFVVARVHPSTGEGPPMVHVDAYRVGGAAEVDDLDLDATLDESVTVVEWGEGVAEGLAESRLEITLHRGAAKNDETRSVELRGIGPRWSGTELAAIVH